MLNIKILSGSMIAVLSNRGYRNRVFCNNIWLKCTDSLKTRFLWRSPQILLNKELKKFQSSIGEVVKKIQCRAIHELPLLFQSSIGEAKK